MNILHVDSSKLVRLRGKNAIEETENTFFEAESPSQALELLKKESIGLIITALEFPGMTGAQSVSIYQENGFEMTPIMVLTSSESIQLREQLFQLGIVDFQLKSDFSGAMIRSYIKSNQMDAEITDSLKHTKIAVVDDSPTSVTIIKRIFAQNGIYDIDSFGSVNEFIGTPLKYDLYLVDLILPDGSGEVLVSRIRRENPDTIILMISSISSHRAVSNALSLGANDFITKPFDANIFIMRIKTHVKNRLLMQALEEKNSHLRRMAIIDGLTDLYNHRYILERLEEEISRSTRYELSLSILLLDLDKFKKINDTYGHQTGDRVLKVTADVITENLRDSDIVGRYGGEEFLVILPNTGLEGALAVAQKVRKAIAEAKHDNPEITTTISGGVATFKNTDFGSLVNEADVNLYKAKNSGRNRIIG